MKAVVFVDVQNDFIDGALHNERAIEVTPKIVEFAKECIANDYKIYVTRDTHEKTEWKETGLCATDDEEKAYHRDIVGGYLATLEGHKLPVEHCIEGTDGWMIDERLMEVLDPETVKRNCTFVNKPTFGSFDLAEIINEDADESLDEIVLCGFCTDICCVSCTLLLRAKFPNTKITVMKDLCAGTNNENHEAALKVMQSCQIDIK